MPVTTSWLANLLDWLLPHRCLGCGKAIRGRAAPLSLCAGCRDRLRPVGAGCALCGRPLAGARLPAGYRCGRCRAQPPLLSRLLAAFSYEPPLDTVILALKFSRLEYLGRHLAVAAWQRLGSDLLVPDAVVPVPLHWRRRWVRGFNQAELIANPLAELLAVPCRRELCRRRATAPQAGLPRAERLLNPRRAFRVRRPADVAGKRLLLIDDVVTTGATLEAAARELLAAGATRVEALVMARTPEPARRDRPVLDRLHCSPQISSASSPITGMALEDLKRRHECV